MVSLYVREGPPMQAFWIFNLPQPRGLRDLKSERPVFQDLLLDT
jgi:hypothetical protein